MSFVACLLVFLGIGIYSATRRSKTIEDYLVASRNVSPWVMALSAVATNNSGFMFVGLIGETYRTGLSSMWLMVGWVFGDYVAWLVGVPRMLREKSEEQGTVTIPSYMAHGLKDGRIVSILAAVIVLLFLGTYAAAQLTAGSKALHVLFGWNYAVGAILGAIIVVAYCFAGGIRASIWTDVAQSIVMFGAMVFLCLVALSECGGWGGLMDTLAAIDPRLIDAAPADLRFGFVLFVLGWMFAGLGVVGQPHIMVRAMTIDDPKKMGQARRIYIWWYIVFAAAAIGVGLTARVLLPGGEGFDAELAMPLLASELLPGVLVGLILAGLFAATMSTADSQILSCSAALTQDLFPKAGKSYAATKAGTLMITAVVLGIALTGGDVFGLVTLAWSSLASGLGPLLVVRSFGRKPSARLGVAMMLSGIAGVMVWRFLLQYSDGMYDVLPGMLSGTVVYLIGTAGSNRGDGAPQRD
ncbi:MAG: sodium/proline symporter [Myxococcota bacterium]